MDILIANKNLHDINPLVFGSEDCDSNHAYGPAFREYYLLHYVLSGKGMFQANNKTYTVSKGQLFIIRPFETIFYQADAVTPWHYVWVGFESHLDVSILRNNDVLTAPECEHLFHELMDCVHIKQEKEFYICGKIYELLSQLNQTSQPSNTNTYEYILKAKNYIESNYMKPISVISIADSLNLDRSYFSGLFRKHIGKSPQKYLVDFRLTKAAELLVAYHYTPGQAAISTGYADIFIFSKMFKRKFGVSPTAYEQIHRNLL